MRVGAIDIGTNSVRLLIAELAEDGLNRLVEKMEVPRLGAGVNQTGYLKPESIERTIEVLTDYQGLIESWNAVPQAVATSAVREAENGEAFISRVKKELDFEVEIISGQQEAELSYLGVVADLKEIATQNLLVDIGGGSTELGYGVKDKLEEYTSIELGAVKLKEKCGSNKEQLAAKVADQFSFARRDFEQLVGVGGTITTLASIYQQLEVYDRQFIHGVKIKLKEIVDLLDKLEELSLAERRAVTGLSQNRADIIVPGISILVEIMQTAKAKQLIVSDSGLLEGIAYKKIK